MRSIAPDRVGWVIVFASNSFRLSISNLNSSSVYGRSHFGSSGSLVTVSVSLLIGLSAAKNNGFGGGPYLFLPALPRRQPKKTIHKIGTIPRTPGIINNTPQIANVIIVHHPGRFRSWWRLIFRASGTQRNGIQSSTKSSSGKSIDSSVCKSIDTAKTNIYRIKIKAYDTPIPNHHCLREIRPRKLKRRYMIAFTFSTPIHFYLPVKWQY